MTVKLAIIFLIALAVILAIVAVWLLARWAYREAKRRRADPLQRALMDTDQELAQFDQEIKQRARVRRGR